MTFIRLARFKDCPVISVAAKPGGPDAPDTEEPQGVPTLIEVQCENTGALPVLLMLFKAA